MKRFFKKFFYGIFYLAIFGVLGSWLYNSFLKPPASCFDGMKNGAEEGVDCGMYACGKICLPVDIRSVTQSGKVEAAALSQGKYSLLVLVSNPNLEYALENFDYKFDFRNTAGEIVKTIAGTSFIYGGEQKYISEPVVETGTLDVSTVSFSLGNEKWIKAVDFEQPRIEGSTKKEEVPSGIRVSGVMRNSSTINLPVVTAVAVFTSNVGDVLGTATTQVDNLNVGESKDFVISHPPFPGNPEFISNVYIYGKRP